VPYDYCRHRADRRCDRSPSAPYPARLSRVFPVTAGGITVRSGREGPVPASAEITARLMVRQGGRTVYAAMLPSPSAASLVHTSPHFAAHVQLSGDGRYAFITPDSFLAPGTTYHVRVAGRWGADGQRVANSTVPGTWTRHGRFSGSFSFRTAPRAGPLPLRAGRDAVTTFELRRMAVPLPAFLPSVNQIGFDSYVLLVGALRVGPPDRHGAGRVLLWATQARRGPGGAYTGDPHGTLMFPLAGSYRGDTLLLSVRGAVLTFSFGTVPLRRLDMRFALDRALRARPGAGLYAEAVCAQVPHYGAATRLTGICNDQDVLAAAGTFITDRYPAPAPAARRPRGVTVGSLVLRAPTAARAGSLTATLHLARGARYRAADHRVGLLLVDGSGDPVGLDYTAQATARDAAGNLRSVRLAIPAGTALPRHLTAYVIADVFPLSRRRLR